METCSTYRSSRVDQDKKVATITQSTTGAGDAIKVNLTITYPSDAQLTQDSLKITSNKGLDTVLAE